MVIDGTTQPGFNGTPIVELDGASRLRQRAHPSGGGITVRGLVINRFQFSGFGDSGDGILIGGFTVIGDKGGDLISGDYIGLGADGVTPLGNGGHGIEVEDSSSNSIGGAGTGEGNVIAANGQDGIFILQFRSNGPVEGNNVIGNLIGTDAAGTAKLGNLGQGVEISGATDTTIGGLSAAKGNVIAASAGYGIEMAANTNGAVAVLHNFIGTDRTATLDLGNFYGGVVALGNPRYSYSGSVIGGTEPWAGNVIAFNEDGVDIQGGGDGLPILGNSIFSNRSGVGIGYLLTTPNTRPPLLTSVTPVPGGGTTFSGTFQGLAGDTIRIEFFSNDKPSGNQGKVFLGSTAVIDDLSGNAVFATTLPAILSGTQYITATATGISNATSSFSAEFPFAVSTVAESADLSLAVGSVPVLATSGQTVTYSLTATDGGPTSPATGVVVTDTIPVGATLVSATPGGFTQSGSTLTFNLGSLASGTPAVITVSVRPVAGTAINTAQISTADQPDPDTDNNQVISTTQVNAAQSAVPILTISGQADVSQVVLSPTSTLVYSFTITNTGNAPATAVELTAALPSTTTFVSGNFNASVSEGVLSLKIGTINAGTSVTASVILSPTIAGRANLNAQVSSADVPTVTVQVAATILPAPVTAPLPNLVPAPTVTGLVRTGIHRQPTTLVLTFAGALDPTRAQNVASYEIEALGGPGRGGSLVGHVIVLSAAVYDPATLSVTLFPVERLDIHNQYRLLILGTGPLGLTGATELLLDGKGDGAPGSDYQATISMTTLEGPVPQHVHSTFRTAQRRWGDQSRSVKGIVAHATNSLAVSGRLDAELPLFGHHAGKKPPRA